MLADADPRFLDCSHTEHNGADKTFREHIEEQKMAQGPPRVLRLFNHEGIIRSCAFIPFNFNGDVHRLLWATGRRDLAPFCDPLFQEAVMTTLFKVAQNPVAFIFFK